MGIMTKKGVELTDDMLDRIADAFERGEWPGETSRIVRGRPRMFGEALKPVTFKETATRIAAMDRRAAQLGVQRSEYLRGLVEKDLAAAK